jgi:polyisoprenoid-binding protein YceI
MKFAIPFSLVLLTLVSIVACNNAPEGQKVEAEEATEQPAMTNNAGGDAYMVDTENTVIRWTGSKPTYQHKGTLKVSSGQFTVADGNLTGGEFVLDMNSIDVTDEGIDPDDEKKLIGHLTSGDFFETGKFPSARFQVTSVAPASEGGDITHNITGNLTMKGITKSVTIPANVIVTDASITAQTPAFTIDRLEWDIKYDAGILGTAKDKIIADEIGLLISLTANKAGAM